MQTGKVILRSAEQFMSDYTPVYSSILSLILGMAKNQEYAAEAGEISFKRAEAVGDIRMKRITPKDSEIKQIAVGESKKTFKKYFYGNQYRQSVYQSREGNEDVVKQVLEENQKLSDELLAFGDGTASNNVLNNGLYFSADPNYTTEASAVALATNDAFYSKLLENAEKANKVPGRKVVFFYGDARKLSKKLFTAQPVSLLKVLKDALPDYTFIDLPDTMAPTGQHGWIIVNMDQIKVNYTVLPKLDKQGVNDELNYTWANFAMGSLMLEVLTKDGVIRQPATAT